MHCGHYGEIYYVKVQCESPVPCCTSSIALLQHCLVLQTHPHVCCFTVRMFVFVSSCSKDNNDRQAVQIPFTLTQNSDFFSVCLITHSLMVVSFLKDCPIYHLSLVGAHGNGEMVYTTTVYTLPARATHYPPAS